MRAIFKIVLLPTFAAVAFSCSGESQEPIEPDHERRTLPSVLPAEQLWKDVTTDSIGEDTGGWTHKLDLADINNDGKVDILFANGPKYSNKGNAQPQKSRVYLNTGNKGTTPAFEEITDAPFGFTAYTRAVKVRDVDGDGNPDIFFGTTHHSGASRLFLGKGNGKFVDVSATNLPSGTTAMGDAEFGDADGDGDLDLVIANWGDGEPCVAKVPGCPQFVQGGSDGGQVLLWLNDGTGKFTDGTKGRMPATKVKFSWDLEFVDIDNDLDLDLAVASKATLNKEGSFLFVNDGKGKFKDVSKNLPQFPNNYEFEIIDFNGDGALDLITFNDGAQQTPGAIFDLKEHLFINDGDGKYSDQTKELWPNDSNIGEDDNHGAVFDFDSDGDADFLIGSLFGEGEGTFNGFGHERLMVNDDGKSISMKPEVLIPKGQKTNPALQTSGTLGIAVADLNGDGRPDVVQSQGEDPNSEDEKVYVATSAVPKDSKPPIIELPEEVAVDKDTLQVRVGVYDNKTPVSDSDFLFKGEKRELPFVQVKHPDRASFEKTKIPLKWYGGTLWRADVKISADILKKKALLYQVCATDAAGNQACKVSEEIRLP